METPEKNRRAAEESTEHLVGGCLLIPGAGLSVVGEAASTDVQGKI